MTGTVHMVKQVAVKQGGGLRAVVSHLNRNRLGELLTSKGTISQEQLQAALRIQRDTGVPLGVVLRQQGLITSTTLRTTLVQQVAWRAMAATAMFVIGFSTMGLSMARATSATLQNERPAAEAVVQPVSIERNMAVARPNAYPSLFGTTETRSADISPFTKWTSIMARLNTSASAIPATLASQAGANELAKVEAVNAFYNKVRYIEDKNNWGMSDYWATPEEFMARGGDCEDYVIAKYAALKALGFSESQLRLAVVQDTWKGIPHAVLVVYTSQGVKFLDNQYKTVKDAEGFTRYRPIYSINSTGWWRHAS